MPERFTPKGPPSPLGCWGKLSRCLGWCEKKPRPGFLTCWWHRQQEPTAKLLKSKLERYVE